MTVIGKIQKQILCCVVVKQPNKTLVSFIAARSSTHPTVEQVIYLVFCDRKCYNQTLTSNTDKHNSSILVTFIPATAALAAGAAAAVKATAAVACAANSCSL